MTPPYRMIDDATGEVATGPEGQKWENIDIPAGHQMELYDTTYSTQAWPRVSPSAIVRPGGETPPVEPPIEPPVEPPVTPPDPTPPQPPTGAGMDYPRNGKELADALLTYTNEGFVGMLDPRTRVELTETVELAQQKNSGNPWGVNGNYAQIVWRGQAGQDMLRVIGVEGQNNRGLTLKNLSLNGGDPNMQDMGTSCCLRLSAPLGDYGSIYKFSLENIFTMAGTYGVIIEGGVYEGMCINVHAENCTKDGIMEQHLNLGQNGQGVVSNVFWLHPNSSRNYGAGMRLVYSNYVIGGSFIVNGDGGIVAADGLRGMIMSNGENTAGKEGAAFVVPNNGYGSIIEICEASSDGNTRCRKWTGSEWQDVGSPMLYLLAAGAGVAERANHVSYYGQPPNPMRVVK